MKNLIPLNTTLNNLKKVVSIFTLLAAFLIPNFGNAQCDLIVDCSNIVDEQLECRADLPPVDFDLPIVVDSCGDIILSALTIIPGNSACPDDTLFVTRTYFINDGVNPTAECMQTFTIVDDVAPMMLCQPVTVELDDMGMGSITTADVDDGSSANCGSDVTLSLSQSSFTCSDVGDVDVWLYGEDDCGNIDSCLAVVTVEDNIDPVITCPMDITMTAEPDRCTAVVCFDVSVTDNCEAVLPTSIADFEFLGTFDDHNYFVSSPGNALGWEEANAAAAAIGGHLVVITSDAEQQFLIDNLDLGIYRIGLRYSPTLGAFKWVNGEPFIYEAWGPGQPGGILEGDYVFNLDFFGTFLDGWYDSESFTNQRYIVEFGSYATELSAGLPAGSNFPVGITEVTYIGRDASNNTDTCTFNVTVLDTQAPIIDCPSDSVIQLMETQCDTLVTFDDPDFFDNCEDAVITQIEGLPSGSLFPIGVNTITFVAADTSGNADTCSWDIIVNDFIPDGMACNGEINFSVDEMTCSGSLTPSMLIDVTSVGCADSCTITIKGEDGIVRSPDFTAEDIGKTFEYEICCGGICCWGDVNVEYKFKPVIECVESDTLSCTQSFDESLITPDISMSCADVELITVDEKVEYLSCDSLFTAKMVSMYTAIDEYGNTSDTCTQTIYLKRTNLDSITPVLPFALFNNNALDCGSGFATTPQGYPFPALSVTGAPRLKLDDGSFVDLFPFESNIICNGFAEYEDEILPGSTDCVIKILRTFTIGEWWCSETNDREFSQLIEVVDFTGPEVTCPSDLTISTASHSCSGFVSLDLPTVSDACNDANIRIDLSAPTSPSGFIKDYNGWVIELPVGVNDLTYHVYDDCGNRTDCRFFVTVRDDADPIAICDQFTAVGFGLEDLTKVTAESVDDGSFDECGPVELSVARMDDPGFEDFSAFGPDVDITCDDVGTTVMVGLLVTDAGGNTNMCMVTLEVQDKIDAQFVCPADMTVDCNFPYDPDNLGSFFGEPVIYDNCPAANTVRNNLRGELNSCGSGELVREIFLLNAQGEEVDYCEQVITFESGETLKYSDITPPPAEVTVTGCGVAAIDPSIIGEPIVPDRECQLSSYNYTNDTFPFTSNGACLKIIRTFKVIDWCIDDGPGSILEPFEFTQTIKVNNTEGPEISVFADSIFCSYDVGCVGLNVTNHLVASSVDDCTAPDDLLNRYEVRDSEGDLVASGSGLDANGYYEVGTYVVRFLSEDKCGNLVFEEANFEVRSCKLPTPYCLQGLSTTLTAMDTTGDGTADVEMVMLTPEYFDAGSYHPCGYDVQLSFSADVNDTEMFFFCSDTVGLQPIELWVTDSNGGQDYCTTFIDVQDNDTIDLCGGLKPVNIAGRVYTEMDAELKDAAVELKSSESIISMTNEYGEYAFNDMPTGGNYQLSPYKDNDHLNGVSTLDLVMIQRHVLGISDLDSPYKLVAADINNNEKITASDLVALRKVILGIDMEYPNNTSWRFIDSEFEFVNESNPWETPIDEVYTITGLDEDMQINFVAVKTGDVNGNVDMNLKAGLVSETRSAKTLTMSLPSLEIKRGQQYSIDVLANEDLEVYGLQNTFAIEGIEILDIEPGIFDMKKNLISINDAHLNVSYVSANGDNVHEGDRLFTLVVKAKEDGNLSEMIELTNKGLNAEVYVGEGLNVGNLDISWRNNTIENPTEVLTLDGNRPNPWRSNTELEFFMPETGEVTLTVKDVNGRLLMTRTTGFGYGQQSFNLTSEDVKIAGVLIYELRYANQVVNGKMIRIE